MSDADNCTWWSLCDRQKNLKQFIPLNQIEIKINTEKEFFFNDLL